MKFSEDLCLFLNRFFPARKVAGRESPQSYSEAQYEWAKYSLKLYEGLVDLKDKIILDAGCGPGGKTVFYSEQGCKSITGIDIDETRLKLAKEFAAKRKAMNVEFVVGSLSQLPFESNSFDLIFLNDVVEHISRPLLISALEECKRVIKPDGKICLEFPPWTSFDASHLYDFIYIPWCQVFFSTETLVNVMNRLNTKAPIIGKLSYVEHFLELNRITIKEAKEMFRQLNFKVVKFDFHVIFNVRLFKYIPFFNKYLTKRVVAILAK
ncbi:MAG TPA: methyltransferase domain-containing protein [Chitinophagales bacterium]|nr:methyltransferase domain-containing protein [Chitinophagales bacterium]